MINREAKRPARSRSSSAHSVRISSGVSGAVLFALLQQHRIAVREQHAEPHRHMARICDAKRRVTTICKTSAYLAKMVEKSVDS